MKDRKKKEEGKSFYHLKRHRNMKERLARSEFKKYFNRIKFGEEAE